ncbi:formin-like protein 14 [Schistocerca piceifrons]|uniref:formin-like protein 14 n=1 Tax=Schistocerca piceifrons TaxID=274613 RepID=UPI001F5F95A7|nr:formin-like protein 14 [Schistocerca piceifrons]
MAGKIYLRAMGYHLHKICWRGYDSERKTGLRQPGHSAALADAAPAPPPPPPAPLVNVRAARCPDAAIEWRALETAPTAVGMRPGATHSKGRVRSGPAAGPCPVLRRAALAGARPAPTGSLLLPSGPRGREDVPRPTPRAATDRPEASLFLPPDVTSSPGGAGPGAVTAAFTHRCRHGRLRPPPPPPPPPSNRSPASVRYK